MPWQPSIRLRDLPTRTNRIVSGIENYAVTIKIPLGFEVVEQGPRDRLLEKQWRARIAMKRNPFARAMNLKWKKFFRDSAKVIENDRLLKAAQEPCPLA